MPFIGGCFVGQSLRALYFMTFVLIGVFGITRELRIRECSDEFAVGSCFWGIGSENVGSVAGLGMRQGVGFAWGMAIGWASVCAL